MLVVFMTIAPAFAKAPVSKDKSAYAEEAGASMIPVADHYTEACNLISQVMIQRNPAPGYSISIGTNLIDKALFISADIHAP